MASQGGGRYNKVCVVRGHHIRKCMWTQVMVEELHVHVLLEARRKRARQPRYCNDLGWIHHWACPLFCLQGVAFFFLRARGKEVTPSFGTWHLFETRCLLALGLNFHPASK